MATKDTLSGTRKVFRFDIRAEPTIEHAGWHESQRGNLILLLIAHDANDAKTKADEIFARLPYSSPVKRHELDQHICAPETVPFGDAVMELGLHIWFISNVGADRGIQLPKPPIWRVTA